MRCWLFAACAGLFLCSYYYLLLEAEEEEALFDTEEIVAYSLLKKIELEGREFRCRENIDLGDGEEVKIEEGVWTRVQDSNLYVFGVYYDARLEPFRYVRILAMIKGDWSEPSLFCQTTTSAQTHHITKTTMTKIWSNTWNQNDSTPYYNPYLLSCKLPEETKNTTPTHIALSKSTNPCRINPQKFKIPPPPLGNKKKTSFTICVKPLNFKNEDIGERLLQWLLINKILGAQRFEIYIEEVSEKTRLLLKSLAKRKFFDVSLKQFVKIKDSMVLTNLSSLWQKRRYEVISYNDCLYRSLHSSHLLLPIDIDEIIVPKGENVTTWSQLSDFRGNFAAYTVTNAYYLRFFSDGRRDDAAEPFFFRDVVRSELSGPGESAKSFVVTENALTVFNHYVLEVLRPGVQKIKFMDARDVQMNHYKNECAVGLLPQCAKYLSSTVRVVDEVMFKYKEMFKRQYRKLQSLL